MDKEIQEFITSYQNISQLKSEIWDIEKSVEHLDERAIERIIEIRKIRANIYGNSYTGRVNSICRVTEEDISFEVSYCGCCENDGEELPVDLLLMANKDVKDFFTKQKKERDEEELMKKKQKKAIEKAELKVHEKKEYERLKSKFTKGKKHNG